MKINIFCIWISHYLVHESKWLRGEKGRSPYVHTCQRGEGRGFFLLSISLYTPSPTRVSLSGSACLDILISYRQRPGCPETHRAPPGFVSQGLELKASANLPTYLVCFSFLCLVWVGFLRQNFYV